jgi:glucan phosphorylase
MNGERTIAYFSMEIGIDSAMPTYSGGLGVLAGDMIRSAADFKVPMVAVTLFHGKGYFHQMLDASGWQREEPVDWVVEHFLKEMLPEACPFLRSRIFQDRIYRVRIDICSATYMKKALSEKILAVITAGASIIAVECPVMSRCSMKEGNRPVPFNSNRLHEVIDRKTLEPLSMIKTDRP